MRHLQIPPNPLEHLDAVVDLSSIRIDRQLRLTGFQPGPAGISTAVLADGVRIAVDYADPRRICFVTSNLSLLASDLSCLGRLLGSESRQVLRDELTNAIQHGDRRRLLRVQLGDERLRQPSAPNPQRRGNGEFGTFIHLLSDISDRDELSLVRAVAAVDVFEQLDSSRQHQLLSRDVGDTLIRFMTTAISADVHGSATLADLESPFGEQLIDLLARAAQIGMIRKTEYSARLFESSGRLRQIRRDAGDPQSNLSVADSMLSIAASPARAPAATPLKRSPLRMSSSKGGQANESPEWNGVPELTSPGRLRIRWVENPGHVWIQVFDRSDLHLIAVAPVRQLASNRFESEAVIPPDRTLESITCELADEPNRSPQSSIEIIEDAVEAGQVASRLSAHDTHEVARSQWQLCADLWEEAGDTTRANLARAYGNGSAQVQRSAFLHDAVRDLLSDD